MQSNFNPHHPQGGDYAIKRNSLRKKISIHTTRKVVTTTMTNFATGISYFNPHHPQGGDRFSGVSFLRRLTISIHTTRKVVTV